MVHGSRASLSRRRLGMTAQYTNTSVKMNEIPEWFPGARLNYAENLLRSV